MFTNDILSGMVLIIAVVLMTVSFLAYNRYRLKAMLFNFVAFFMFFLNALIYSLNSLLSLNLDVVFYFLLFDLIILVTLYLGIAVKG